MENILKTPVENNKNRGSLKGVKSSSPVKSKKIIIKNIATLFRITLACLNSKVLAAYIIIDEPIPKVAQQINNILMCK